MSSIGDSHSIINMKTITKRQHHRFTPLKWCCHASCQCFVLSIEMLWVLRTLVAFIFANVLWYRGSFRTCVAAVKALYGEKTLCFIMQCCVRLHYVVWDYCAWCCVGILKLLCWSTWNCPVSHDSYNSILVLAERLGCIMLLQYIRYAKAHKVEYVVYMMLFGKHVAGITHVVVFLYLYMWC